MFIFNVVDFNKRVVPRKAGAMCLKRMLGPVPWYCPSASSTKKIGKAQNASIVV